MRELPGLASARAGIGCAVSCRGLAAFDVSAPPPKQTNGTECCSCFVFCTAQLSVGLAAPAATRRLDADGCNVRWRSAAARRLLLTAAADVAMTQAVRLLFFLVHVVCVHSFCSFFLLVLSAHSDLDRMPISRSRASRSPRTTPTVETVV